MPSVDVGGVRLDYDDAGSGEVAVVFVHGWCCDRTYFAPQAAAFARTHRVVSPDLRGHGTSGRPDHGYHYRELADDVAGLIASLELDRPVVVGHSMGGTIAFDLAVRHPALTRGIVGVDPAIYFDDEGPERIRQAGAAIGADEDGTFRQAVVRSMFRDGDGETLRERVVEQMSATPNPIAAAALTGLGDADATGLLGALTVPAMVIWADPLRRPLEDLRAEHPDVDWRATPGVGHFTQLVVPEQVTAMIAEHLGRL